MGDPNVTELKAEDVKRVSKAMHQAAIDLNASDFKNLKVGARIFSELPLGSSVAQEHHLAHRIVDDTIRGVAKDLEKFGTNIDLAISDLDDTDFLTKSDFDQLGQTRPTYYYGDSANHQSRRDHLPPTSTDAHSGGS